jgi:hypothetical protein
MKIIMKGPIIVKLFSLTVAIQEIHQNVVVSEQNVFPLNEAVPLCASCQILMEKPKLLIVFKSYNMLTKR